MFGVALPKCLEVLPSMSLGTGRLLGIMSHGTDIIKKALDSSTEESRACYSRRENYTFPSDNNPLQVGVQPANNSVNSFGLSRIVEYLVELPLEGNQLLVGRGNSVVPIP